MIGIYKITNKINGDSYYGSSVNIKKRWDKHIYDLKNGKHHNIKLQRAWVKYGEDNFIFEIIEECGKEDILIVEQRYLNLKPKYNIGLKSSGGDNLSNNPNREEIIQRIGDSVRLRYSKMNKEEINKIHSRPGESNHNWKGGISKKYCKCGKKITTNNKTCIACVDRTGSNNSFFGKKHTDEFKNYLRKINTGVCRHDNKCEIVIDGIEYESYNDASKKLNISLTTIRWRVLSKNPKYKGYQYKNKENFTYTDEEQKMRLSEPQKNKKRSHNKPFIIDDVEYRTLKEASIILNIHSSTIKSRLKSPKFDNYEYKD